MRKKKIKRITRTDLRGTWLDEDCKRAHTAPHLYGPEDPRVFCYALYDPSADGEILPKCKQCRANVDNATPWKGGAA